MARARGAALTAAALGLMLPALAWAGEGRWTSQGPNADAVTALAIDPSAPETVFAATQAVEPIPAGILFGSEDGGASWRTLVPSPAGTVVAALAFDAQERVLSGLLSSGDLFQSADGGASWRFRRAFALGPNPAGMTLDPHDPRTIYVFGSACPVTGDCGRESPVATIWRQLPGQDWQTFAIAGASYVTALAIDPTAPGRLYAGTDTGVWKSADDARNWQVAIAETDESIRPVSALAVGADGSLLLGSYLTVDGMGGFGAVYRSTDTASTWQPVSGLPYWARAFVFEPANPRNVWAVAGTSVFSFGFAVYRSTDGGRTWLSANEGLEGLWVLQLAIDEAGHRLYAATGAGVFDREVADSGRSVDLPAGPRPSPRSVGPRP
ncbi:MAG TPA: sialidase family protein [Thermoanaerobaculia bacterium]|nr:sialidase family protein [Thermoanaerobaculia bacterium]